VKDRKEEETDQELREELILQYLHTELKIAVGALTNSDYKNGSDRPC